jgi:hypothetical protein
MPRVEVDRNLLFGLLALQTGLIDQGALFSAFNLWTREKGRSMAAILAERGDPDASRLSLLEALLAEHLKMHGDDAQKSLAGIDAGQSTREGLAQIKDADVRSAPITPTLSARPPTSRAHIWTPASSPKPCDCFRKLSSAAKPSLALTTSTRSAR